ncbi:MAG: YgiQ family radical SAM protein [Clostridiales bacterium]|nr:YgiQ family radical SAM protein [Clostridiales bacterium]
MRNYEDFLPVSKFEIQSKGWDALDFILVSGDAYIDHPSFGGALIARVLERAGYKVGIISQPKWTDLEDIKSLGKPRLGFLVTAGNMDSMVNHYSSSKRRRKTDLYSPGGKMGLRPDRAVIVYTNLIKQAFKDSPVIIGGIEASLRRLPHYDYWEDSLRRSVLYDSGADLLVYGMAEKQILEIAEYMNNGIDIEYIQHIKGTCFKTHSLENVYDYILLPSFKEISESKKTFAEYFKIFYDNQDPIRGKVLVQEHDKGYIVQNIPIMPLDQEELDYVYELPFTRDVHPMYDELGSVPAIEEVKFSIVSNRGCFGSCSFCALTFHQGRAVQSRSKDSIVKEADEMIRHKDFKGYIHDVGGPTANFRQPSCKKQLTLGSCKDRQCLFPTKCPNLDVSHEEYLDILRTLRNTEGVKKVFIRSGIRYDYLMYDKRKYFKEIVEHHVSGQLKVAPEHIDHEVLKYMGKPDGELYKDFVKEFYKITKEVGKDQYIIPYLISSHPGSTLKSAIRLAEYLKETNYTPEQVQDFYPTPGTLSTCMYYTGIDPRDMKAVYVPSSVGEKKMQRALLQFKNPKNRRLVHEALIKENRYDLIGYSEKCLVKPIHDK